jgi:2-dehydro-3-deoxygluconokinase
VTGRGTAVVAFGELLLRLAPPGATRIVQAESFEARYTGAEANVAVALTCFGLSCVVVSKVPADELGQACVNYVRRFGVDTTQVRRGGERLGTLYLETGVEPRSTKIIYDRLGSAFARSQPEEYDWDEILHDARWLHFSGTAPASGAGVAVALERGLRTARDLGVTVSCDINYRAKLSGAAEAGRTLARLMPYVEVLTGSGEDAARVFAIPAKFGGVDDDEPGVEGHARVAQALAERFGVACTAGTLRHQSTDSTAIVGVLCRDGTVCTSGRYVLGPTVDRIGAGDAFSAGVIFGLVSGWEAHRTVEFATASCCLKHSIEGDFALLGLDEVEALVAGSRGGRVQR